MPTDDLRFQVNEPAVQSDAAQPVGLNSKDDEVYLLDVLIALAERKRTILLTTAAFAILAIVISLILPKTYTATLSILPPQQNSSISAGTTSNKFPTIP